MEKLCNKDSENGGRPFDCLPVQVSPVIIHCVPHLWLLLVIEEMQFDHTADCYLWERVCNHMECFPETLS